jgi:hypothetical protein
LFKTKFAQNLKAIIKTVFKEIEERRSSVNEYFSTAFGKNSFGVN